MLLFALLAFRLALPCACPSAHVVKFPKFRSIAQFSRRGRPLRDPHPMPSQHISCPSVQAQPVSLSCVRGNVYVCVPKGRRRWLSRLSPFPSSLSLTPYIVLKPTLLCLHYRRLKIENPDVGKPRYPDADGRSSNEAGATRGWDGVPMAPFCVPLPKEKIVNVDMFINASATLGLISMLFERLCVGGGGVCWLI